MDIGLIMKQVSVIQDILKEYHINECLIFGSRLKGSYNEYSDFDIAVEATTDGSSAPFWLLMALCSFLPHYHVTFKHFLDVKLASHPLSLNPFRIRPLQSYPQF